MSKKRVICPECGYHFTIKFGNVAIQAIGVRSKRITGNQFEYSLTAPTDMIEDQKFTSLSNDAILAGLFGISTGVVAAGITRILLPANIPNSVIAEATEQAILIWGGLGSLFAYGWLCAEYETRLKRILPWFMENKEKWAAAKDETISGNVELTIDHRYRDGNTESGRTINRFGVLPVDVERFNEWAQGAIIGKSLAVGHWTPKTRLFTRPEYDQLLIKMKAGGLIVDLGSNKGNTLTGGGRRALSRHLVDCGITPPSPASEADFLGERLAQAAANNNGNTPLPRSEVYAGGQNGG
jgi:hypothetical protein